MGVGRIAKREMAGVTNRPGQTHDSPNGGKAVAADSMDDCRSPEENGIRRGVCPAGKSVSTTVTARRVF